MHTTAIPSKSANKFKCHTCINMIQLDIIMYIYVLISFKTSLEFSCVIEKKVNFGGWGVDLYNKNFHNACYITNKELNTVCCGII